MNKNSTRFLPLRTKLAISFAILAVVSVGLSTFVFYQNTRARLRQDIRERLHDAVAIGALQVDAQKHAQLTDPSQEGNEPYLQLKKTLQGIRDAGTNIRFVYTMQQDAEGNIIFVVDAEESEEDISHLGDIYDDASPWLLANFSSIESPLVEDDLYTDKWGTWLTGYAPFYTADGRREGVLGMDISAEKVLAQEQQVFWLALIIFILSIPLVSIAGWLLGNTLAAPISKLTEGAEKLTSGDFTHRVRINSRDEIESLADAFNSTAEKLSGLVAGLEQRVYERTNDLSRRSSQLKAAAQVARQAAAIKDPSMLVNDAVRLISKQFGFYHAGLFLLDDHGEYALLQSASSEGGQRMLARGHRLRVGSQGIVGFVAAQKRPRIALDTGADAVYFDNPDLPNTRSEAALPLIVRDRIIGVLDIQSEKPQAFTQEDIETFQTLADQLALAVENARLFGEMDASVQKLEQVAAQRARQAWTEIGGAKTSVVQYTPMGVQDVTGKTGLTSNADALQIPITLHNQRIGAIKVQRKDEKSNWSPREHAMLQEIATQVGLALENARLLNDAQKHAANERVISEVTARIGSAFDVDSILRVTAQEIGRAIGDAEVSVQIRNEEVTAKR
jgi:GAF domain-containing protein/HAMP domain-containing protein